MTTNTNVRALLLSIVFAMLISPERVCPAEAQEQQHQPSTGSTLTDEDYRRICLNLRPGETAEWCAEYGLSPYGGARSYFSSYVPVGIITLMIVPLLTVVLRVLQCSSCARKMSSAERLSGPICKECQERAAAPSGAANISTSGTRNLPFGLVATTGAVSFLIFNRHQLAQEGGFIFVVAAIIFGWLGAGLLPTGRTMQTHAAARNSAILWSAITVVAFIAFLGSGQETARNIVAYLRIGDYLKGEPRMWFLGAGMLLSVRTYVAIQRFESAQRLDRA